MEVDPDAELIVTVVDVLHLDHVRGVDFVAVVGRNNHGSVFFAFYRLMFSTLAPEATFSGAMHFQALAWALERVANGEIRRLLIAIPPRHGKSLFASVAFPAWILGRDPTRKIICASYGDQLSRDFSNRFRDLLWSSAYQALFLGAVIAPNGSSLSEVRLTSKGYRLATTVQGPATGKGAHLTIVDDPFKAVEAASEAVRNAVYDWFKGSLMTRFDNPAEGAVIVVMQRLHQDDLVGRLRDEGGWEYLAMPGECSERTVYDLGDGQSWTLKPELPEAVAPSSARAPAPDEVRGSNHLSSATN